ncbi:MAG TPA: family 10 glycosylhydrolase [Candidatus Cloacimonadota bacterium]|nr:family 10 glycosylhydrolase [Candidatus Cloacimonadota bacterium]
MPKKLIPLCFFLIFCFTLCSAFEIRALWVTPWNLTTKEQIDELVNDAVQSNQTEILAEVRYRADALYIPNKMSSQYSNPEPRYENLTNPDFDPLQYLLEIAHANTLEVQAWLTVFCVTPTKKEILSSNYIYQNHQDWILTDNYGNKMNPAKYSGYFIDPGNPEVRNYLINVILNLVDNYPELDGIHLDYIRYPDRQFGYNSIYFKQLSEEAVNGIQGNDWRKEQITEFLRVLRSKAKSVNPRLLITAAVIANVQEAEIDYAQDWINWLNQGIIDRAYPMAYVKKYGNFYRLLSEIGELTPADSVVIGLRAWQDDYPKIDYPAEQIIEKANLVRQTGFAGMAMFNYDSLKKTGMLPLLANALWPRQEFDLFAYADDEFLTQITTSYRYYNYTAADTLMATEQRRQKSVEMIADPPDNSVREAGSAYCDYVSYQNEQYYFTFFFPSPGKWSWEIIDLQNSLIYKKQGFFPQGFYIDVWNGVTKTQEPISPGIYTLIIKDEHGNLSGEKKFIVK